MKKITDNPSVSLHTTLPPSRDTTWSKLKGGLVRCFNKHEVPAHGQTPSPFQRSQHGIRSLCPAEKAKSLVGKTIDPRTAQKMRTISSVDALGVITAIKSSQLSKKDYAKISSAVTTPLTQRPQPPQQLIRTPKEVLIALALAIEKSSLSPTTKQTLTERIKSSWLDNNSSNDATRNLIELLQLKLASAPKQNQALLADIKTIAETQEKDFHITKRNDNYHGRIFETELATYVIDNPTSETHNINEILRNKLLSDFDTYDPTTQAALCKQLYKMMLADPPVWRHQIKESQAFLEQPTPENFAAMLHTQDPYAIPLSLSLAVKYMLLAPNLAGVTKVATQHYLDIITDQRQKMPSLNGDNNLNNQYGLLLPHQLIPAQESRFTKELGIRPIDRQQPATQKITPHNQAALAAERPVALGMSGSTNLLNHLFMNLTQEGKVFCMDHAKIMTAAYLTFSGGHSINEAYTVFAYNSTKNFKPLCFNELSSTNQYNAEAVDHAYRKVLDASARLNALAPAQQPDLKPLNRH